MTSPSFRRDLSKAISRALRHEPWLYELELDEEDWATIGAVVEALTNRGGRWAGVSRKMIEEMVTSSERKRHEIAGDRIRAIYGHSLPGKLKREPASPPEHLYHGTSRKALVVIRGKGLQPMGRQYVHLSVDEETAIEVGRRKTWKPVLLVVQARRAHEAGVGFYLGNENVWLADEVPAEFLSER